MNFILNFAVRTRITSLISRNSNFYRNFSSISQILSSPPSAYIQTLTPQQTKNKIENYIGCIPYPTGVIGPVLIDGEYAKGEFFVPLSTLEGTLVAGGTRGAKMVAQSAKKLGTKGIEVQVLEDRFMRAVYMNTSSLSDAKKLIEWCKPRIPEFIDYIHSKDPFIKIKNLSFEIIGCGVFASLECLTGDAMGSNMASKASHDLLQCIKPSNLFNFGYAPFPEDKKAIPFRAKGKKVIARAIIDADVVFKISRANIADIDKLYSDSKTIWNHFGVRGCNVHISNYLTALHVAFGQDVAYIGESVDGCVSTKLINYGKQLEITLNLPSLIVATVGGGTALPAFVSAFEMIGCKGTNKVKKFAEICASVALLGEINCSCALVADEFVKAHETMCKNNPLK